MDVLVRKKEVVKRLYANKILVTQEILSLMNDYSFVDSLLNLSDSDFKSEFNILLEKINKKKTGCVDCESGSVEVLINYDYVNENKRSVQDFITFFNNRFNSISRFLTVRQELSGIMSISRIQSKKEREIVSFVGFVIEKQLTKNNNFILSVEDPTGVIKVLVTKNKPEVFALAQDAVVDDILGFVGTNGQGIVFANNIIFPDVPLINELKKGSVDDYFVVLSDVHVGSKYFLGDYFDNFLKWINGNYGNEEQIALAKKVKYVFIVGDIVDGVGIYPSQEEELNIPDIYDQYKESARLLSKIPEHIKVIICPGNHDACRLAEPQPIMYEGITKFFKDMKNIIFVSNPGMVRIGKTDFFEGFKILLYHGYSFDYYSDKVYSIKNSGRHISERSDLVMKFLLQRRHLAPSYGSTIYTPDVDKDYLIIEDIPDFFLSGHIHRSCIDTYRGITLISGSCFQAKTSFQEKVGHDPDPAKIPVVNLKTRQISVLNFNNDEEGETKNVVA